jgi:tryptophanyl-tRNA synthetase
MKTKIACTGIKPTGVIHIGNYLGSIKPALELAKEYDTRYFIADYHALNSIREPQLLKEYTYEVAASWLACGLDPKKSLLYRQSSVAGTFEIATMLMAFTAKGLMNRAHAYKAITAKNLEAGNDTDDGVNMGLFTYPILMAADILQFDSDVVPVGKDQAQHLEMTVDIAQTINYNYQTEVFRIPQAVIQESTGVVIGLDGRKMSKSYDNTIPLFLPEKKLRKLIMKIVTNSQSIEESKDPEKCTIFSLYKLFAETAQIESLKKRYLAGGLGWGEAKQLLFEAINEQIKPYRQKYDDLMQDKVQIDKILEEGSDIAQEIVANKLNKIRKIIGLR